MLMLVWFWARTAAALAPTPRALLFSATRIFEAFRAARDAAVRPLIALGWAKDAPLCVNGARK